MSIARRFARAILNGFDSMFAEWQNITLGAQSRFERAEWHAVHTAMADRLTIYRRKVHHTATAIGAIAGTRLHDRYLWREAKREYADIVLTHSNAEIAQTFFNSCYCFVFGHEKVSGLNSFALEEPLSTPASFERVLRNYQCRDSVAALLREILTDIDFSISFEDLERDIQYIIDAAE
ncbi:MAG TPA: isocitrate dehydrogenase kinase/phosphatase AceK regulatory subunit, partial [Spongiibacteraceae bacterium]|nr:isocitrate dehydrogenase kinase/phosphatase AceK regulatory subunit [Spongiibacteraceae bacterium]